MQIYVQYINMLLVQTTTVGNLTQTNMVLVAYLLRLNGGKNPRPWRTKFPYGSGIPVNTVLVSLSTVMAETLYVFGRQLTDGHWQ